MSKIFQDDPSSFCSEVFGYPLVKVYIAMENHHVEWENSLFPMAIFISYFNIFILSRGYFLWVPAPSQVFGSLTQHLAALAGPLASRKQARRPVGLNTVQMLKACSSRLGMSPAETMRDFAVEAPEAPEVKVASFQGRNL